MRSIDFSHVTIRDGFWKEKQDMVRETTVWAVYDRFKETHRFDALRCEWKEGDPDCPHIFWDSDVAKWMEGAAYLLAKAPEPALEKLVDEAVGNIVANMDENGYFNSHFLVTRQEQRFHIRNDHELYCAGHLMEAAVAYYQATGKDAFLKAMCRYADYIERVFKIEDSAAFSTPGHPELELALVRLYEATGEKRYLELSKHFIDLHGNSQKDRPLGEWSEVRYNQDEMPLRNRATVDGHSVRALYLLAGAADIAAAYGDEALKQACRRCYENATEKRMYITGGVGSTHIGEAFTVDYDLPNRRAYTETCASIALAYFADRCQKLFPEATFADTVERVLYNGILSGISLDGKAFFYENPLEIDPAFNDVNHATAQKERFPITQRKEVFDCSCCPPNILRLLASVGGYAYAEDADTVYVNQYMHSSLQKDGTVLSLETCYPADGKVHITCKSDKRCLALRIPAWCTAFTLNVPYVLQNGYAVAEINGEITVDLHLEMPVVPMAANRRIHENAGRIAVMRGPVVYCAEAVDNGEDIHSVTVERHAPYTVCDGRFGVPELTVPACRPPKSGRLYMPVDDTTETCTLRLIPYFAFANRGESEMLVWLPQR